MSRHKIIDLLFSDTSSWLVVFMLVFGVVGSLLFGHVKAATQGQSIFYLHAEPSDANEAYNMLAMGKPEWQSYTAPGSSSSTTTNATPATNFCKASTNTAGSFNQLTAIGTSAANYCMSTFISAPVGQAITMSTGDASAISGQFWSSESKTGVTAALNAYVYRWTGSGTSVVSTDRLATFTCADPGTSATSCAAAAVAPANTVNFAATDRLVVILSMNVTGTANTSTVSTYFDNSSQATMSNITLKYTMATPNKPTLTGTMDDDFTTALATLACNSTGVAMTGDTKWTCLNGTATNSAGDINDANTSGSGGDESGFIKVHNTFSAAGTSSDFGTTPSNTFLYQSLPSSYGDGTVRTVVESTANFKINTTSASGVFNHQALTLWLSNTDYLEVQLYATAVPDNATASTVKVALNNSGTLSGATGINSTVSNGLFGRVWLGFSDTGGSYQAQYSTDGTTWNNVGSAVSHSIFTRVGLDSYTALGAASGDYSGAYDWFQSTLASPSYNQTNYQWFAANGSNITPGSALGSMSSAYTTTAAGAEVRLRLLLRIAGQSLAGTNAPIYQIQYADKGAGSCASPTGSSYANMSTSTVIALAESAAGNDNSISSTAGDPTDSPNTVVPETFGTANTGSTLPPGEVSARQTNLNNTNDGEWDFALIDNGASAGHTYCLRLVNSDGTNSNYSYTNYPTLIIYTPPGPTTDQVLRGGEWFSGGSKQPFFWAN